MPQENSAGAIVFFKEDNKIEYLLLYRKAQGHYREAWDFSRGLIEKDEAERQTVLREVKEETGLDVHLLPDFECRYDFFYKRQGKTFHKDVILFLAETDRKEVKVSEEHDGFRWCRFEEAMDLLTFKESKNALEEALEYLEEKRSAKY